MVLPRVFSNERERIIASFPSTDLRNGTGYEDYFLIESEDSGGKDYHLTPNRDFSNSTAITTTAPSTIDLDYDLTPFALPQTINGMVLISIPAESSSGDPDFTIELYKVDDAGETQIGSTITFNPLISTTNKMLYFRMPIVNEHFRKGEILRLRVVMVQSGGGSHRYGIDPAGRTDANLPITTTSKVSIPFKIDL